MTTKQLFVLIAGLLVNSVFVTQAAKILFLSCTPAPSHQKPFQVIWRELSLRGHDVHVLTPNPINDPKLTNLTEYDLSSLYELVAQQKDAYKYLVHKPSRITAFIKDAIVTKLFSGLYNQTLNHAETRRLLDANQHFDVVIVEWIFPTLASIAAYYNAPIVGITSLGAPLVALDTLGNPSHPIVAPDMNLPLKLELSLLDRIFSVAYSIYVRLFYWLVVLPREDANIKKYLSSGLPYLGDIEKNVSLLLMNRNPTFHRVMPLYPNTVDLGGIHVPTSAPPLDPKLESFLDNAPKGVVYFSLGSSMKSVFLSNDTIRTLQKTFESLPYKFVWKWEDDNMAGKPENVLVIKWVPQVSLLEHPNVKLFITQGGLQSIEETIAAHKPLIGIPFHSDQTTNVDTCVKYGMGKMLDLEDLTEETLRSYIVEIINNSSYAENAKKLDELMKDQPQDGLKKAIWWIEYVIRHKGAKHLRSTAVDLPLWQYLMLDVIGFILGTVSILAFGVYYAFKILFCIVRWLKGKGKKEKKKRE